MPKALTFLSTIFFFINHSIKNYKSKGGSARKRKRNSTVDLLNSFSHPTEFPKYIPKKKTDKKKGEKGKFVEKEKKIV